MILNRKPEWLWVGLTRLKIKFIIRWSWSPRFLNNGRSKKYASQIFIKTSIIFANKINISSFYKTISKATFLKLLHKYTTEYEFRILFYISNRSFSTFYLDRSKLVDFAKANFFIQFRKKNLKRLVLRYQSLTQPSLSTIYSFPF